MSEHLSEEQMSKYVQKELRPKELLKVGEHLSVCEDCRSRLAVDSDSVADSFQQEFAEPLQHLTYDQLVAHLEKEPDNDRELVETHLQICSQCKREYEDLHAFSMELHPGSKKAIYRLVAVAAIVAAIALVVSLRYRETPEQKGQVTPVVVSVQDAGTRLTLDRSGKLSGLKSVPEKYQKMVRIALLTHQLEISKLVDPLITQDRFIRGESEEGASFRLVKPVGTVVASDRPEFQWESLQGASKYRVTVLDANMNVAADSGLITTTSWIPDQPLQRDSTYIWQVAALLNGKEVLSPQPPAGEARFRVLDRQTHEQLEQDRQKYPDSLLLLGLLSARVGLLDDAQHNFQKLAKANPNSQQIKQLLANLERISTPRR